MKKHLILTLLSTVIFFQISNSQVNNLSDFLYLSELSEYGLTDYLQSNWELQNPTETIEKGKAVSVYTFTYDYRQTKQILKRVINLDMNTAYKIRSTTFISDDLFFLERIEKSLSAKEFFEVGNEGKKKLYEDGNRMFVIERDFHKKAKGLYKITIMYKDDFILYAEKSKNSMSEKTLKTDKVRVSQKWNIKGVEDDDLGTFYLKVYENWDCYIELYIKGKLYKSSKCDSENETALLVSKTNTLSIEYSTPELVDVNIDILGNNIKFDYVLNDNTLIQETKKALPIRKKIIEDTVKNYRNVSTSTEKQKFDREIVFKPKNKEADCVEKGLVTLEVVVDANGNYINSEVSRKGTTNLSSCLLHQATQLAKKYKWNKVADTKNENIRLEINFK